MPDAVPFYRTPVIGPASYPTDPVPVSVEESVFLVDASAPFDGQYEQAWLLVDVPRRRWTLGYQAITLTQLNGLRSHRASVTSTIFGPPAVFAFVRPGTGLTYVAFYAVEGLSARYRPGQDRWEATVRLEEVLL